MGFFLGPLRLYFWVLGGGGGGGGGALFKDPRRKERHIRSIVREPLRVHGSRCDSRVGGRGVGGRVPCTLNPGRAEGLTSQHWGWARNPPSPNLKNEAAKTKEAGDNLEPRAVRESHGSFPHFGISFLGLGLSALNPEL